MTFYTHSYENEDDTWTAQLKLVHPPFELDDDDDVTYSEQTMMVAFGETKEAALLQIRAALNSALGAVELDIMRGRGHTPRITTESVESDVIDVEVEPYDSYDTEDEEDDESGD